jgi:hypothetical protein
MTTSEKKQKSKGEPLNPTSEEMLLYVASQWAGLNHKTRYCIFHQVWRTIVRRKCFYKSIYFFNRNGFDN